MSWQDIVLRMRSEGPDKVPFTDYRSVAIGERGYGIAGFHRCYGSSTGQALSILYQDRAATYQGRAVGHPPFAERRSRGCAPRKAMGPREEVLDVLAARESSV